MKKKLLSVCLALALAFSLLPAAAFAAEEPTTGETTTQDPTGTEGTTPTTPGGGDSTQGTPTSPQDPNEDESDLPQGPSESSVAECNGQYYDRLMDAIPGSGKVTLLQDVSGESIQIPSGSNVTIDLAGHDLVCTGMDLLTISGDLTIQDSTGDDPKVSGMIRVLAGASLNISAGSYSGGLDVAIASGTCKISGGRFPDNYLLENYLASGYVRVQDGRETSSYPLTVVRASTSGTLITGVKWSVSGGTLTFSGKGAIPDYGSHLYTPWIWLGDRITNVVLQDGITKIGVRSLAFLGDWFGGTSLTIPASVTAISDLSLAFSTLSTITFQGDAPTYFAPAALQGQKNPLTIRYPSGNSTWDDVINQSYGSSETVTWEPYIVTVDKETPNLVITPSNTSLTGGGTIILVVSGVPQGGRVTVSYNGPAPIVPNSDGTCSVTLPDKSATYTFTATYDGDETHNPATATCTVTVTASDAAGETVTNPDGSTTTKKTDPDGTVTETTKYPDGSSTVTVTKPDGSVTITETDKDGNIYITSKNSDGSTIDYDIVVDGTTVNMTVDDDKVTADVDLSQKYITSFAPDGVVVLPMPEISAASSSSTAPTVSVALPDGTATSVKVEIPVDNVTAGTVAMVVYDDGTQEIIKTTLPSQNGIVVVLDEDVTLKVVDNRKTFSDVASSYWGANAITFATSRGIFSGTSSTQFSPDVAMSRAMIVTVLAAYEGVNTTSTSGPWYSVGRQWAMEHGISDGTNMDGSLTREQLATMLWRYAGSPAVSGSLSRYPDGNQVSSYATQAMAWAVNQGLISGMDDGSLAPQGQATRAQIATIMMRFCENSVQ